jgi:hypothetical protein
MRPPPRRATIGRIDRLAATSRFSQNAGRDDK